MRWLYALGVDHSKQIWFQTSELIMDEKHSDWWITEVEKPASELHLYSLYIYMYVYTYWFRFHLPGSNASAHIKLMCSFILLQDVKPPGDWLDVAFQKAQWQWANPQSYSLILHTESSPLGKPSPSSSGLCILTKGTIPKPSGKWQMAKVYPLKYSWTYTHLGI